MLFEDYCNSNIFLSIKFINNADHYIFPQLRLDRCIFALPNKGYLKELQTLLQNSKKKNQAESSVIFQDEKIIKPFENSSELLLKRKISDLDTNFSKNSIKKIYEQKFETKKLIIPNKFYKKPIIKKLKLVLIEDLINQRKQLLSQNYFQLNDFKLIKDAKNNEKIFDFVKKYPKENIYKVDKGILRLSNDLKLQHHSDCSKPTHVLFFNKTNAKDFILDQYNNIDIELVPNQKNDTFLEIKNLNNKSFVDILLCYIETFFEEYIHSKVYDGLIRNYRCVKNKFLFYGKEYKKMSVIKLKNGQINKMYLNKLKFDEPDTVMSCYKDLHETICTFAVTRDQKLQFGRDWEGNLLKLKLVKRKNDISWKIIEDLSKKYTQKHNYFIWGQKNLQAVANNKNQLFSASFCGMVYAYDYINNELTFQLNLLEIAKSKFPSRFFQAPGEILEELTKLPIFGIYYSETSNTLRIFANSNLIIEFQESCRELNLLNVTKVLNYESIVYANNDKTQYLGTRRGFLFKLNNYKVVVSFGQIHKERIFCMAVTYNNKFLFTSDLKGNIRQWSVLKNTLIRKFKVDDNTGIYSMKISEDDKWLYVGTYCGKLYEFSINFHKSINNVSYQILKESDRRIINTIQI